MAIKFNRSQTFATNGTVTAAGLHNLVDGLDIYQALITDQTNLTSVGTADELLIADADLTPGDAPKAVTVQELFNDALTVGTYTDANLTGNLTYGTATGNRTVSTSATITTGTIPNLTAGTTTGTLATLTNANITNGTIQTLTSSTATITGGTFSGSVNSTAGTIGTLNSTTGTIGNLSTTLAGDVTISQGTATLGTSGVTASSYGTTSDIPRITVDAKGRITSATTVTAPVGFRNRLINSDMRIDQRNAGASVTIASNSNSYTLDRWSAHNNTDGTFTVERSTSAPSSFTNSIKVTVTATDSTIGTTQNALIAQYIEGNNFSDLAFGTLSAGSVALSFWVNSNTTGTFSGSLQNSASDRSYPFSYTVNSANTWEKKNVAISGDTSGTWVTDMGIGARVWFALAAGSSRVGTAGIWSGSELYGATGQVNLMATNSNVFYITGVQLEAGSTATDFERRPYGTELALCQRYYQKFSFANNEQVGNMSAFSTTGVAGMLKPWLFEMRSTPTLEVSSIGNFAPGNASAAIQGNFSGGGFTSYKYGIGSSTGITQGSANLTAGICSIVFATSATAYLAGNSEL